ncbi:hypothetical protein EAO70_06350 [Streptomyces sp. adm13(2018)]|uniref:hypothetical protein n=1 Tax=Streptomyces sp. adm13(2018) TaxID=2479007 RepID=UPI0011CEAEF7|nr:hypothetical protein [Streptomyces sp. adm13(2018)]TXS22302.1 hypothetical protein EAO70_06350 [Streptomyces sp. adm13(2018)]
MRERRFAEYRDPGPGARLTAPENRPQPSQDGDRCDPLLSRTDTYGRTVTWTWGEEGTSPP